MSKRFYIECDLCGSKEEGETVGQSEYFGLAGKEQETSGYVLPFPAIDDTTPSGAHVTKLMIEQPDKRTKIINSDLTDLCIICRETIMTTVMSLMKKDKK